MAAIAWTSSQREAIEITGGSLLVRAGAGSGKTAVLAERSAYFLADARPRCGVDGLLVVTFTDAAAAEMRQRIEKILRARLNDRPRDAELRRQIALIDTASISTIHAFCRRVLNRYFAQADLDPSTPILDPNDAELLRREAAQGVFDAWADENTPRGEAFLDFVASYGPMSEERLIESALALQAFLDSVPDPSAWLADCRSRMMTDAHGLPIHWLDLYRDSLHAELKEQHTTLTAYLRAIRDCPHDFAAAFASWFEDYTRAITAWRSRIDGADVHTLEAICNEIAAFELARLPAKSKKITERGEAVVAAFVRFQEQGQLIRDRLFKPRLVARYGSFNRADAAEGHSRTARHLATFLTLVEAVGAAYSEAKLELGVMDFADLERRTLGLLRDESNRAAERLREQYQQVLVDEFQDINPVQAEILRRVSREHDPHRASNFFAVGDVKQSIYRFRLAEPLLFLARANQADATQPTKGQTASRTVDLRENFRSRPHILEAVNEIFERLMSADLGDIAYDQTARLVATRAAVDGATCELHVLDVPGRFNNEEDSEDDSGRGAADWEQIEREAYLVASRIRQLLAQGRKPRDIVILLRSMKPRAGLFLRTLLGQGIAVFADMAGGIFESLEVMDVISLLALLDNLQQDIPFAAILRGPMLGDALTDDELVEIRLWGDRIDRWMPFHERVRAFARQGPTGILRQRLMRTFARLEDWRQKIRRRPLADVLWEIYESTGYLAYVAGLRDGAQRHANLLRLHEYARQFGDFHRQGLFRFLRFIESLAESDRDLDAGSTQSAASEAVRVMTIHRSKGLEFPVVILAELGKRFNMQDAAGSIVFDRQLGVALEAVDRERRILYPTIASRLVSQAVRTSSLAEEIRVLYVAMTRAREQLVMVGSMSMKTVAARRELVQPQAGPLPLLDRQTATSMLAWVVDAVCSMDSTRVAWNADASPKTLFAVRTYPAETMSDWILDPPPRDEDTTRLQRLATLGEIDGGDVISSGSDVVQQVQRRLTTAYPFAAWTRVPSVVAASVAKRQWQSLHDAEEPIRAGERGRIESSVNLARPTFLTEAEQGDAAQRGTWTHEFLQRVDLCRACDETDLRRQFKELFESGVIDSQASGEVDVQSVAWFFSTELGRRLRAKGCRVLREWPFVQGVDPGQYDPAAAGSDDVMLVRGIIDCLFDDGNGWEIIDYKTDNVRGEALTRRVEEYRGQVAIYAAAAEAAWGRAPAGRWLVFLTAREVVRVE